MRRNSEEPEMVSDKQSGIGRVRLDGVAGGCRWVRSMWEGVLGKVTKFAIQSSTIKLAAQSQSRQYER